MDREIKFRVWHADYKKMELPEKQLREDIDYWDGVKGSVLGIINNYLGYSADKVFMQFTGLLDKNGKEIYEGDILQHPDGEKFTVVYKLNYAAFRAVYSHDCSNLALQIYRKGEAVVIGNIYDSPELLKEV